MAKKGKGRKMVRNVARRIKSKAGELDIKSIIVANAGGFGAAFAIDKIDDIKDGDGNLMFADKPLAAPLIVEGLAVAGSMFLKDETAKIACYGAMGGAAAQLYAPVMDMVNKDDAPANGTATINAPQRFKNMIQRIGKRLDMHKAGKVPTGSGVQVIRQIKRDGMMRGGGGGMRPRLGGQQPAMVKTRDLGSNRIGGWRKFSGMGESC